MKYMFYPLERLINLHDGYQRAFSVAGKPLLLVQNKGRCQVLINQCPHQQASLVNATLDEDCLRCPIHGMRFDLTTGRSPDGCTQSLQFISIAYEGNQLGVDL
jgi:3-phenylpropionate/trans-cinnamate dioxygenase ferredoxin subunit